MNLNSIIKKSQNNFAGIPTWIFKTNKYVYRIKCVDTPMFKAISLHLNVPNNSRSLYATDLISHEHISLKNIIKVFRRLKNEL